ncbi:cytochrome P450 [Artomyces pyxidatus]|uniref:Cytochrome P450 n=1 Tax=Artomyces pyxidatus TaxID=48021 RepID=A0ACB8SV28_9AGAM|nr:cytochrome P450 [Artomyces pyxidatus]
MLSTVNCPSLLDCLRITGLSAAALVVILALASVCHHRIKQVVLWRVPGPPSPSFLTGSFLQMFDALSGLKFRENVRKTYGTVSRFSGPLGDQVLLISDPMALSNILVKNQDIFEPHEWLTELFRHSIGPGLLSSTGTLHRRQRKMLNPIFSTQQMRSTTPLFQKITNQLRDVLRAKVVDGPAEVEVIDWFSRAALEMIAQGGLGYTFDSLSPDGDVNEFKIAIKEFMPTLSKLFIFLPLFLLVSKWPSRVLRFVAACFPLADVKHMMKLVDTTTSFRQDLFEAKKALLAQGDVELTNQISGGKDIVSVLMRANADADAESKMEDEEIMAQMMTLLGAATESTSNALARTLQLLAQRPDVQGRLRQELNDAFVTTGSELGYDELMQLPYLDAICRETLRLYPPASFVTRVSRVDTTLLLSRPIQGNIALDNYLFVPQGTTVVVDIIGVNTDPNIWGADADVWKPERWLAPLPGSVSDAHIPAVYSNMLTFLGGARSCIGFKLAELEMKVVVSQLTRSFRFLPSKTEIVWRLGHVTTPSLKGSRSITPQMTIVLENM